MAIGATLIGASNGDGTAQTQGVSGTAIKSVVVATCGSANGIDSTSSGLCAKATQDGASAYGSNAQATAANTTAVGFRALASSAGAVALGYNAQATGDPTVAIGYNSLAAGNNSVALGANAQAVADNSIALGAGSVADQANTVSVGSAGNERRITNVAAGVNPTDAVNVSQLNNVQNQLGNVQRIAYSGIAMSMAMSGAVMPTLEAGDKGVGVGLGSYRGYGALALQFKAISKTGNSAWGGGISTTTGGNVGLNIGIGFKWK
ncbi:Type IV fimbrial biogenesis protein PilY1 [Collimonas arenae]|uniref:Type IV fimbrial biogenesis protein PilY1 n=2 Tax=Collimonas arenae TaxID=279058 RepID=A0A0A1FBG6_9BURK|nr:Type IV fimbrial biogenesis protein PilY1 [Collimonas arenae]